MFAFEDSACNLIQRNSDGKENRKMVLFYYPKSNVIHLCMLYFGKCCFFIL
jgi:hypothetical protein